MPLCVTFVLLLGGAVPPLPQGHRLGPSVSLEYKPILSLQPCIAAIHPSVLSFISTSSQKPLLHANPLPPMTCSHNTLPFSFLRLNTLVLV